MLFYCVILIDNSDLIVYLISFAEENRSKDVIRMLQRFLAVKDRKISDVILGSASRILVALLSNFETRNNRFEDAKLLLHFLINNPDRASPKLSDYINVVCLSGLLLIPGISDLFLLLNGVNKLTSILKAHSKDLQTTYYCLLCFWQLSYENLFQKQVASPKVY